MKLLTWCVIGLNLFSASLGFFDANENWSINLVTACAIYVIFQNDCEK